MEAPRILVAGSTYSTARATVRWLCGACGARQETTATLEESGPRAGPLMLALAKVPTCCEGNDE
jgi:hypothetical protein